MKHIPTRTCIVCKTAADKNSLLRVVRKPDGSVVIDRDGHEAGRGAYVCSGECIKTAIKRKLFNRAFKRELGDDFYSRLSSLVEDNGK